ncbi:hypothetical protein CRE_15187 [Caenorhabditis remanei]|uniref:Uncharacterized protein n=1 Tax=Caenorhabditis remanei TaxID=31234 RepID=E3NQ64_CAERE|nr:hypothetical protein CRE_15187 [Caenorhabditis remanei]
MILFFRFHLLIAGRPRNLNQKNQRASSIVSVPMKTSSITSSEEKLESTKRNY